MIQAKDAENKGEELKAIEFLKQAKSLSKDDYLDQEIKRIKLGSLGLWRALFFTSGISNFSVF